MEASMSLLRLQCSCPCKEHSTTAAALQAGGRPNFSRQRVDSNSFAGSRKEFGTALPYNLKSRSRLPSTTRCLVSPLVESYASSKGKYSTTERDGNEGGLLASPSSISFLKPVVLDTRSEQYIDDEEKSQRDSNEKGSTRDDNLPAPQDPVAASHGDSLVARGSDGGRDFEARRSARYQPQTMSLTHSFRSAANQGVSCAIGVAGRPIANATKIGGPAGLMMGLAVAGLGIATAIHKASETQPQQKLCTRCDGYGVECCDVCGGAGQITWESKVHRTNPCPRCFGSRLKKCPRCDGCRAKKESKQVLVMLKTPPRKK